MEDLFSSELEFLLLLKKMKGVLFSNLITATQALPFSI